MHKVQDEILHHIDVLKITQGDSTEVTDKVSVMFFIGTNITCLQLLLHNEFLKVSSAQN